METAIVKIKDFPLDKIFWGYKSTGGTWHYSQIGGREHFRAREDGEAHFDYENQRRIHPVLIKGGEGDALYSMLH